ncbi:MAG: rubrerythrin family protein [Deltaproteobacteria bacterium]|nr:rubrerythrin family protein [Deltaproteobacteria bacterium]
MSKTEENLKAGFAGESQARNKYTYFAEVAREEGYHYIAKIFEETAENEKQHAKDHLKMLKGIGNTIANLKEAIGGEHYETTEMYQTTEMYPTFAKKAKEEGNSQAAISFQQISKIEAHHRERYKKLLEMVEKGTVFKREQPIKWKCRVCGYVVEGTEPPPKCPSCKQPKEYYEPANMDL